MAYVRPANKKELVAWIMSQGLLTAAAEMGVDVDALASVLADALIDKFDLVGTFKTPV